jgi:hypothetical protein
MTAADRSGMPGKDAVLVQQALDITSQLREDLSSDVLSASGTGQLKTLFALTVLQRCEFVLPSPTERRKNSKGCSTCGRCPICE